MRVYTQHKYICSFTYTESREIFKITTFMKIKKYIYILFRALTLFLHFHLSKPCLRLLCVCCVVVDDNDDVDCLGEN